jgi:ketosteroid isomerase-like protein
MRQALPGAPEQLRGRDDAGNTYGSEEEMTLETLTKADDKAQIRGLLDDWAEAARSGDIDAIMTAYAPDILAFDAIAHLQFKGADAYRTHWQACIEMCSGPMIFEIHDLSITAGEGVAFGR